MLEIHCVRDRMGAERRGKRRIVGEIGGVLIGAGLPGHKVCLIVQQNKQVPKR